MEKKSKIKDVSVGYELRKVMRLPLPILCTQLGVSLETAKLIQALIHDLLIQK